MKQTEVRNKIYTITKDLLDGKIELEPLPTQTQKFRILDDDDEVYFEGMIVPNGGEEETFAPIDNFGIGYGAPHLQFLEGGKWVPV